MWCHLLLATPLAMAALFVFLPLGTAIPVATGLAIATALIVVPSVRALRQPVVTGRQAVLGAVGQAVSDLTTEGLVRVRSELWLAEAWEPIARGSHVQVLEVSGAKLRVRRLEDGAHATSDVSGAGPDEPELRLVNPRVDTGGAR